MRYHILTAALLASCLVACDHGAHPATMAASNTPPKVTTPMTAAVKPSEAVVVYVDDLDLTKAVTSADEQYKGGKNVTPDGTAIKLDGKSYAHAFGINSAGTFVINLKGAAKSFSVTVGIDDDSDQGSCRFFVIGDGKVLAKTGIVVSHEKPHLLEADLTGVQQLVLKCDDGDDTIDYDHADWVDGKITLDPSKSKDLPVAEDAAKEKPAR